jgi:tetratricopeptide (TPR) repeat protein
MHATGHSADALPIVESAQRMRQELLDAQPDHLDYRSELAGTWNDIGLVHYVQGNWNESLAALQRAIDLQKEVVQLAPHVPRYRRFLCNHCFNRAMSLASTDRLADAAEAVSECRTVLPHDADQWIRVARIQSIISQRPNSDQHASEAVAAVRQAIKLGFRDFETLRANANLSPLRQWADFAELMADLERRAANADRQ